MGVCVAVFLAANHARGPHWVDWQCWWAFFAPIFGTQHNDHFSLFYRGCQGPNSGSGRPDGVMPALCSGDCEIAAITETARPGPKEHGLMRVASASCGPMVRARAPITINACVTSWRDSLAGHVFGDAAMRGSTLQCGPQSPACWHAALQR